MHKLATILIVEDNEDLRFIAVQALKNLGATVIEATNVSEARTALTPETNLVLLDLRLTDERGETLLEFLKSKPEFSKVKVVLMSAGDNLAARVTQLGADGFIAKPATRTDIQSEVLKQLKDKFRASL